MGGALSQYTTSLANGLCGGSSRKLIAGWWYSILGITGCLMLMSIFVMGTRSLSEGFASIWSALMLLVLSIGGTMIMRKFHNSMAVGFFMGGVVAMSQLFFILFLVYIQYGKEQKFVEKSSKGEMVMSLLCLVQCILLGSFAAILGAHRSEILDKPASGAGAGAATNTSTNGNAGAAAAAAAAAAAGAAVANGAVGDVRPGSGGHDVPHYDPPTRTSSDNES